MAAQAPTYNGILHKKGEKGIKTYKKRWCILLNNEIQYFKDEKDYRSQKEPLGKIQLVAATVTDLRSHPGSAVLEDGTTSASSSSSSTSGGSVIKKEKDKDTSNHCHFKIDVPGRTYSLFTESNGAADGWIKAIKSSKEYHNPVNQQSANNLSFNNNTLTNSQAALFGSNSLSSNQTQAVMNSSASISSTPTPTSSTSSSTTSSSSSNLPPPTPFTSPASTADQTETTTTTSKLREEASTNSNTPYNTFGKQTLQSSNNIETSEFTSTSNENPPAPSSIGRGIALPGMAGISDTGVGVASPRTASPRGAQDPTAEQRKVTSPLRARPKAAPSPGDSSTSSSTSVPLEKPGRPPRPAHNTLGKPAPGQTPYTPAPALSSSSSASSTPATSTLSSSPATSGTTPAPPSHDGSSLQHEIHHLKKVYGSRISSLEAQLKGVQDELRQKDQSFRRLEAAFLNLVQHVGLAPDSIYPRLSPSSALPTPAVTSPASTPSTLATTSTSSSSEAPESYPIAGENRPRSSSLSDMKFRNTMAPTASSKQKPRNETMRPSRTTHLPSLNSANANPSAGASSNSQLLTQELRDDINRFQLEGYAKAYFHGCNRKFQFRRKKVELKALLSHSKDEYSAPLLKLNAALSTQAVLIFRFILTYMGDLGNGTQLESSHFIQQVIEKAIQFPELRDEIYCQLCKQTCNNPSKESYYRGWDVLVVCVNHFVPTKNLEPWLLSYLAAHLSIPGKDSKYAHYCIEKLQRVGDKFTGTRVPTIQEIEREKEYPFGPSIFGCSLENAMELQRQTHPQLTVPVVVYCLLDAVVSQNGFSTEGIFRIAADGGDIYKLRHQIDCGNYDMSSYSPDPHIPANLLKLWLRDLPTPLIPFDLYPFCIDRATSNDPRVILDLVDRLPSIAKEVLLYIIAFMQSLATAQHQPVTKMGFSNLAIIFAPSLLRPSELTLEALQNSQNEIQFVLKLFKLVDAKQRLMEKNGYLPPFLVDDNHTATLPAAAIE